MLTDRKQVRIINLGDVITPDFMKAIQAFTTLIAGKKQATMTDETGKAVAMVLHQNLNIINDFKHGKMNEADFTNHMLGKLEQATGIRLSTEEFDASWNAMNPKYQDFKGLLSQVSAYNRQPGQRAIFISFTNPKDIKHLIHELHVNQVGHRVVDGCLLEIEGIELHTTYAVRQTKAELIESVIKSLHSKPSAQSSLASSMGSMLAGTGQTNTSDPLDIKYLRGVNNLKDPVLQADLDLTNQAVEEKADGFRVDTILWMKQEQSLSDIMRQHESPSRQIRAINL
ncbi:hypothetical protein AQUSIP_12300 [Aquicella siphonis]|uniref:Uncharacterized protein n=1 Tax=Aquicella siphonis TaxID=254247 RepID=A0A5E4PG69_9COXI|nr:hypothetical protein [Aquicella siphonis]VVC75929.1 hypothetical protein AQUSIP_12300 [Aquicella siphonis]